jgi:hypothetical protein
MNGLSGTFYQFADGADNYMITPAFSVALPMTIMMVFRTGQAVRQAPTLPML